MFVLTSSSGKDLRSLYSRRNPGNALSSGFPSYQRCICILWQSPCVLSTRDLMQYSSSCRISKVSLSRELSLFITLEYKDDVHGCWGVDGNTIESARTRKWRRNSKKGEGVLRESLLYILTP